MSCTKRLYEDLAEVTATALYKECSQVDSYYKRKSYADIVTEVESEYFLGNFTDSFDELLTCISEFNHDIVAEFPETFSAICVLLPYVDSSELLEKWHRIIVASNSIIYSPLVDAYQEYYDMGDPSISEAKEWIRQQICEKDYVGILSDLDYVIAERELTEVDSPHTFIARSLAVELANC